MSGCGCGCGGSIHTDIVTELISAGVATTVRGPYDEQATYAYGDMVVGSDGKNYVYLCRDSAVAPPNTGTLPTPGSPTAGTGPSWSVLPAGFVSKGVPALFITTTHDGFPVSVLPGTSFMEIFQLASEPLYPTVHDFPAHNTNSNMFAIDRSTGQVWYSNPSRGWVNIDTFVGTVDGDEARSSGVLSPPRASIVVQSYTDLATVAGSAGQRYLVVDTWEVVARV